MRLGLVSIGAFLTMIVLSFVVGYLQQIARCKFLKRRNVMENGKYNVVDIPPKPEFTGKWAKVLLTARIREGEDAIASGDVIRMIAAYKSLEGCE